VAPRSLAACDRSHDRARGNLPLPAVPDSRGAHGTLVAGIVVALELITISLIRKRFLAVSLRVSLLQVALGGAMIVGVGVALGNA